MLCKDALIKNPLTTKPDKTVEHVLKEMQKAGAVCVPVLDAQNIVIGLFSINILLEETLPVALAVGPDDARINVTIPSAPGITKRLQKLMNTPVSDVMRRAFQTVGQDSPLESAIRAVCGQGAPVIVANPSDNSFLGMITDETLLAALKKAA